MKILLLPYGSNGDVLPFVGVGMRLKQRGHDVTLATNGIFAKTAAQTGLPFHEIGTANEFNQVVSRHDEFRPLKAARLLATDLMLPLMPRQLEAIRCLADEQTILINASAGVGFGAHLAHEKFGMPLITLQLYPMGFWSVHQPPKLGRSPLSADWVPAWLQDLQRRAIIRLFLDPLLVGPTNNLRLQFALKPVRSVTEMMFSPQRIVALFPDWFAPAQPDWPSPVVHAGFPLWDEGAQMALTATLEEFLDGGDPPIVFTPGSFLENEKPFFEAAIDACQRLGRRGLLLTRHASQIPSNLPNNVIHVDYAPFSLLLPRCGALVSHGGIGTLSAALAAGIPQLVMPIFGDHFDNAARIKRLGVGEYLWKSRFDGPRVARILDNLLTSPQVLSRCSELSHRMFEQDGIGETCEAIEAFGKSVLNYH